MAGCQNISLGQKNWYYDNIPVILVYYNFTRDIGYLLLTRDSITSYY